ncbi:inactive protein RESTRICTED TEV MOVEMENT 2-like [Aristolochia californica]|uniref:inactive protein RESTRICTED TEV MOVEMENT 2-like n=1 Tax=Aristolochia californica TaxID=171875 RepID=UPI0035E314D6
MDAAGRSNSGRVYEDLQVQASWVRETESNTLLIDLPGFKKEQLRVQLDNIGNLKISGERLVTDNKWTRFRKDFRIPENSNLNSVRAKFEKGTLYVIIPTTITQIIPPPQHSPPSLNPTQKYEMEKKTKEEAVINGRQTEEKWKQPSPKADSRKVTAGKEEKGAPAAGQKAGAPGPSCKLGRAGLVQGLLAKKPNLLVVKVVSFLMVVGIGVYVAYKYKAPTWERNQN